MTKILIFLFTCLPIFANSADKWPYSDEKNDTGIYLYLVENKEQFLIDWAKPDVPLIEHVSSSEPGTQLALVVLFKGVKGNKDGNCQLYMDLKISTDNGKSLGEGSNIPVCTDQPPPLGILGLGEVVVDLKVSGASNNLIIDTIFADKVSGERYKIQLPLEVKG